MKPNITIDSNIENITGDNIVEVPSFSLGLTRGDNIDVVPSFSFGLTKGDNIDNTDGDDIEEDEFYIRENHSEDILVEKKA